MSVGSEVRGAAKTLPDQRHEHARHPSGPAARLPQAHGEEPRMLTPQPALMPVTEAAVIGPWPRTHISLQGINIRPVFCHCFQNPLRGLL